MFQVTVSYDCSLRCTFYHDGQATLECCAFACSRSGLALPFRFFFGLTSVVLFHKGWSVWHVALSII
jgi:hypothetical protein